MTEHSIHEDTQALARLTDILAAGGLIMRSSGALFHLHGRQVGDPPVRLKLARALARLTAEQRGLLAPANPPPIILGPRLRGRAPGLAKARRMREAEQAAQPKPKLAPRRPATWASTVTSEWSWRANKYRKE